MEPNILWGDRFLLTGPPKAGKSTMAATFPRPFVINTDGPSNEKYIYLAENPNAIIENVYSYEDLNKAIDQAKNQSKRWDTLILDLLDVAFAWGDQEVVKSLDRKLRTKHFSIGEAEYGAGWEGQYVAFQQTLLRFWAAAEQNKHLCASVVIAHSYIGKKGKETLLMRDKLSKYVQGRVQHVAHILKARVKGELEFSVDFGGGTFREAGSRCRALQSAGIITPPTFEALCELVEEGTYSRGYDEDVDEVEEEVTETPLPAVSHTNFLRAMGWLERNGVPKGDFEKHARALGLTKTEAYELVKRIKQNGTLSQLKKEVYEQ